MLNTTKKFKRLSQKVGKTIYEQQLLQANDKILVGLSGGKDSNLLLELMADRRRHLPFPIEIFALHVKVVDVDYFAPIDDMKLFCDKLHIPFIYKEISIDLHEATDKKSPCFLCSWNRRKTIFTTARELNCNKVALAHHFDDVIETFMLNLIYHASISSLPYELKMFDGEIKIIRPLLDITEKEILAYTREANYPLELKQCSYSNTTKRTEMKNLIKIMKQMHPLADKNIFRAGRKIYPEYLPISKK